MDKQTREISVTTAGDGTGATCFMDGMGNLEGNPARDEVLLAHTEYVLLDKSDGSSFEQAPGAFAIGGLAQGSGSFSISQSLTSMYTSLVIAFKTGNNRDPSWAAFALVGGVLAGDWSIAPQGALSHANLYGVRVSETPLPAALPMLASALGLGGLIGWRRKRGRRQMQAAS